MNTTEILQLIEPYTYAILIIIILILIYKIITAKRIEHGVYKMTENLQPIPKTPQEIQQEKIQIKETPRKGKTYKKKDVTEDFELGIDKIKLNFVEKATTKGLLNKLINEVQQIKHKKERLKEEEGRQQLITQTIKLIDTLEMELTTDEGKIITEIDLLNMKTDQLIELHESLIRKLAITFDIQIKLGAKDED